MDGRFVLRMLGYYGGILERCAAMPLADGSLEPAAMEIRRILIYLGEDRWTPAATLDHTNLKFRFEIVNVIDLEPGPPVEGGDLGDAVFALLCRDGTSSAMMRAILARIAEAAPAERSDALAQLLVIATLRKARARLMEVQTAMAITVNVADIPLLREPIDRAFAEGLTEALLLMLAGTFGPLPPDLASRLMALQREDVTSMISRVHAVATLKAVLGNGVPRGRKARTQTRQRPAPEGS